MLIIFDLDDTLIDTSGSVTPQVLKNALSSMQKKGFCLAHPKQAFSELLRLNAFHLTSDGALREFLEIFQAPKKYYEIGKQEIYENPILPKTIFPLEDAPQILEDLSLSYPLSLVTKGKEDVQREKMKRAGIDVKLFSYLSFCEVWDKKKAYQKIQEEAGISPGNTLVCGDRISFDLSPAKELGYKTVQMRWGRGLGNTGLKKDVDYTILHLKELKKILQQVK